MYDNVQHVHKSQIVGTIQASTNRWMNQENVVQTHNRMLLILENEWVKFLYRWKMDELWKHYAKWNKPDMKEWILCNSSYMCILASLGCFNKMP